MRSYISIDIETTGLDTTRSHVLQIGAVYDDGVTPLELLPTFNVKLDWDHLEYAEIPALVVNASLLNAIREGEGVAPGDAFNSFIDFLESHKGEYRMQLAGKNVAGFDIPILKNNMSEEQRTRFSNLIQSRTLDVGSMYATQFGFNPTLDMINKRIGYQAVTHDALEDAMNVVFAIRSLGA